MSDSAVGAAAWWRLRDQARDHFGAGPSGCGDVTASSVAAANVDLAATRPAFRDQSAACLALDGSCNV